jgi:hypothetical protein
MPAFEHRGRVHDWRNHVPSKIEAAWNSLSLETRLVVFGIAEELAGEERWD